MSVIILITLLSVLTPVWGQTNTTTSIPTTSLPTATPTSPIPTAVPVPPILSLGLLAPMNVSTTPNGIFGPRLEAVARLAIADILAARDTMGILPYTNLTLVKRDTASNNDIGMAAVLDMLWGYDINGPVAKTKTNPTNTDAAPIVGLIGDFSSAVSQAIAPLTHALKIPLISMGAASAALASRSIFPMFARNYINEALQSEAILSLMTQYKWKRAAILYLKSGTDSKEDLIAKASTTLDFLPLPLSDQASDQECKQLLKQGMDARYRIFIILITPTQVPRVVNATIALGMNNGDYAFIAGKDMGQNVVIMSTTGFDKSHLRGWIGIPSYEPNPQVQKWANFSKRLTTLYPQPFLFGRIPPIGFDAFTYEIVWMYALALHNLTSRGVQYWGQPLYDQVMETTYEGVTGQVVKFKKGERWPQVYNLVNWNSQANVWIPFGQWNSESGFLQIPNSQVIFPSGSTTIPLDTPPRQLHQLPKGLTNATMAVAILFLVLSSVVHVWLAAYRNHLVIKTSAWLFCHVMVFGLQLGFISVILKGLSMDIYGSIPQCSLFPLFLVTGLSCVTAPLFVKTWRLQHIFDDSTLTKRVHTNKQLMSAIGLFCLWDWIIIGIWNGIDQPMAIRVEDPLDRFNDVNICIMSYEMVWWILLVAPKGAILLGCCYLAYKVRNLPANFNESKYIGICLYVLFFVAAIILPIIGVIDAQIILLHVIIAIAILATGLVIGMTFFVPKAWNQFITQEWRNPNATYIYGTSTGSSSHGTQKSQSPTIERKPSINPQQSIPGIQLSRKPSIDGGSINPIIPRGSTASVSHISMTTSNARVATPQTTTSPVPSTPGNATNFV